jgi:uncharacterized protein
MAKTFLGVGVAFPVRPDEQGAWPFAAYEDSVRQSILIILGTARGERLMRPDFGCGIYDLVFEPNDDTTAGHVSEAVSEALLRLEPRIDVVDVGVRTGDAAEVLLIDIRYQVRATNNVFNLVYPFYLEQQGAA